MRNNREHLTNASRISQMFPRDCHFGSPFFCLDYEGDQYLCRRLIFKDADFTCEFSYVFYNLINLFHYAYWKNFFSALCAFFAWYIFYNEVTIRQMSEIGSFRVNHCFTFTRQTFHFEASFLVFKSSSHFSKSG